MALVFSAFSNLDKYVCLSSLVKAFFNAKYIQRKLKSSYVKYDLRNY